MATKAGSAFGDIAWELYSEPLEEFTKSRNARAKELKDDGDRRLAGHVHSLEKPSVAAWLLNQMVRQRTDEVDQVLELGSALRAAQEDLAADELRQLDRQRRQLLTALTTQVRGLGRELGRKVTDQIAAEVEGTLHAAMVDEAAAKALRSGLLVNTFSASGFGAVDLAGVLAIPDAAPARNHSAPRKATKNAASPKVDQEKVAAARAAVSEAEERLKDAQRHRRDRQAAAEEAEHEAEVAADQLRKLREQIRRAERELRDAQREAGGAAKELDPASHEEDAAERAVKRAMDSLARLT